MLATFTSGALTISVDVTGSTNAAGTKADALRATIVIDTGELVVRKFDVLAPLGAWTASLAELVALRTDRVALKTVDHDVELTIEHIAGNLRGHLRVRLTAGLPGSVEGTFPTTLTAVEELHRGLEEASWAFQPAG